MVEGRRDQLIHCGIVRKGRLVVAAALMSALLAACGGDSDSPAAGASTPNAAPVSAAQGRGTVTLSWTPPTENEDGTPLRLTSYRIYWGNTRGNYPHSVTLDNPGLSRYVVEQLTPATWYFVVTAVSADGESAPSNEIALSVL
jgi:fibronectin type III domain protein